MSLSVSCVPTTQAIACRAPAQILHDQGYVRVPDVLTADEGNVIGERLRARSATRDGLRALLQQSWCARLAQQLRDHAALSGLLPAQAVAVQCTYFEKSPQRNWLVALHQDLSIPVAARIRHPDWRGWSCKNGTLYAQPPVAVLERLLAVRIHLDACDAATGPLRVVPQSHRYGRLTPEAMHAMRRMHGERILEAARGEALLMRPLLAHASSKITGMQHRRVLHVLFAPPALPDGARWTTAI